MIRAKNASSLMAATAMLMAAAAFWAMSMETARAATDCLSATGAAAVAACRQELRSDPGNRDIRLALSDAYLSLKQYEAAVFVLREGFEFFPGDDTIKRQLMLAESYLEEQQWIDQRKKDQAEAKPTGTTDTQTRLSVIRCNKLKGQAAIAACNDGLKRSPGNPDLLIGRGKAWMTLNQYGRAVADFQSSLAAAPGNRKAATQLRLAQTKRKINVSQCLEGTGSKGLAACDAALLIGTADEFSIRTRQGRLLHAMGREKAALRAYRAAARLNPTDTQVQRALAALTPARPPVETAAAAGDGPPAPQTTSEKPSAAAKPAPTKASAGPLFAAQPSSRKTPEKPAAASSPLATQIETVVAAAKPSNQSKTMPAAAALPRETIAAAPAAPVTTGGIPRDESEPEPGRSAVVAAAPPAPPPSVAGTTGTQRRYSNLPRVPGITH
jgi:tetratricopeptide (TPR) repeat protein